VVVEAGVNLKPEPNRLVPVDGALPKREVAPPAVPLVDKFPKRPPVLFTLVAGARSYLSSLLASSDYLSLLLLYSVFVSALIKAPPNCNFPEPVLTS
jgi:hypothetical protein